MPGALLWGYDATNKVWIPLAVDANGYVKVDLANVNLDDLGDVSVASPADDDLFYYDNATSLWKSRKLVNADIPAAIARDAEVIAAIADHADDTTGVHGAGSDHLALFPVASTVVSKFTAKSVATELWRRDAANNSSFEALINGAPSATSVVYDNDVRERSLPDPSAHSQWAKVILYNITRGNSRKITDVSITTNTITTESSVDDWANNDIITIGSQTCDFKGGYTYSRYFDIDISPEVPATATAALLELFVGERSGASTGPQNSFGCQPFETYAGSKVVSLYAAAAYEFTTVLSIIPVVSQKMCVQLGAHAAINASNVYALIRLRGYWE